MVIPEEKNTIDETREPTILEENFTQRVLGYIFTSQCVWGKNFTKNFFRDMVKNRLRCNSMNFVWVHTGGDMELKGNWRKISVSKAQRVYEKIRNAHDELMDWLAEQTEKPKKIRQSKWARRQPLLDSVMPKNMFGHGGYKKMLMDTHDDLPKLK